MDIITLAFICTGLLFWGGYQTAKRFLVLGSIVAVLLLFGAWFLVRLNLGSLIVSDGAPTAAGAFIFLLILLEFVCIALAGTLLVAGWRSQDDLLAKTLFIFLLLPFASFAIYSGIAKPNDIAKYSGTLSTPAPVVHDEWKDGYAWAIDHHMLAVADCKNGAPKFLAGCVDGVNKNLHRHPK